MPGGQAGGEPSAPERLGLQQRLESGRVGRWLISAFLVVTVGGMVIANLPAGPVQRRLAKATQPYMNVTTLYQRWNMYAPYPRKDILYLEARVVHADGRVTVWRPPADGPVFGPYRDSHWRKYIEHALPDRGTRIPGRSSGSRSLGTSPRRSRTTASSRSASRS